MTGKPGEHTREADDQRVDAANVVSLACQRLESHPWFHRHCQTIRIECVEGRLVLTGRLPSFYLKQLTQEALRGLAWPIDNQIDVVCSDGLSSTRLNAKPEHAPSRKPR